MKRIKKKTRRRRQGENKNRDKDILRREKQEKIHQAALTDEKQDRDAALKPDYMSDTTLYICIKIVSC